MSEARLSDAISNGRRAAVVTGGGKGVGRAIAERLAADGLGVLVNNRHRPGTDDSAGAAVAAIRDQGGEARAERSDVAGESAAEAIVSAALATFGRLDVLILNAGIAGEAARFEKAGPDAFADVMRINFDANIRLAHEALPHLKSSLSARIVVIGSTAGIYGVKGRAPYAASKGALIAFALTLAAELERDGILVNVLFPYAATQMTGDAAGGSGASHFSADKIGPVAGWLASEACDVSGRIMLAGGGLHRRVAATEGPARFLGAAEQDFGQHAAAIDDLDGVRTFREAESAFAAFATEAARAAKEARS